MGSGLPLWQPPPVPSAEPGLNSVLPAPGGTEGADGAGVATTALVAPRQRGWAALPTAKRGSCIGASPGMRQGGSGSGWGSPLAAPPPQPSA